MNIRIGDTVRFLNDIGGGKVVGFNGPSEVIVEQEDGFGFPAAIAECVVVESNTKSKPAPAAEVVAPKKNVVIAAQSAFAATNKVGPNELNVFLAFAPTDFDNLDQSDFELYLINNSEYSLFLSLTSKQGDKYKCVKNTLVGAGENLFIDKTPRSNIAQLEQLHVQIVAYKGFGQFALHKTIDKAVTTKLVKLCKQSSFAFSSFLGCQAMSIDLTKQTTVIEQPEIDQLQASLGKLSIKAEVAPKKKIAVSSSGMLEVDLHIDSLLDSTAGMSSGDMLEYQMDYFRKVIADNERFSGKKIIFIHGKGDGVLRSSLERELKRMGRGNKYQQASFKKYGYGAILVII